MEPMQWVGVFQGDQPRYPTQGAESLAPKFLSGTRTYFSAIGPSSAYCHVFAVEHFLQLK